MINERMEQPCMFDFEYIRKTFQPQVLHNNGKESERWIALLNKNNSRHKVWNLEQRSSAFEVYQPEVKSGSNELFTNFSKQLLEIFICMPCKHEIPADFLEIPKYSLRRTNVPHLSVVHFGFYSSEATWIAVFRLPSPHRIKCQSIVRLPPSIKIPGTQLYTWGEIGAAEVKSHGL